MVMTRRSALALALVSATACGSATAPEATTAGHWNGAGGGFTMTLSLQEESGNILGTGVYTSAGTWALTVSGERVGTTVSLTITPNGRAPTTFAGSLTQTAMTGTLNGSGFTNAPVTFTRP